MKTISVLWSLGALLTGCAAGTPPPAAHVDAARLQRIQNVVVIYAENHSFDNLYGMFPGANGVSRATPEQETQIDHDGKPLPELIVFGAGGKPNAQYPRLPNAPFRIDAPPVSRPPTQMVPSPTHNFFHNQEQINGGRNNLFAAMSNVGGWTMGYYDGSAFKLWQWARDYTLADNFFMGAFGGSYLNHQYLICACAPRHADAPASMRAQLDANGKLIKRPGSPSAAVGAVQIVGGTQVTPDGYSVNTSQPAYQPSGIAPSAQGPRTLANPAGVTSQAGNLELPLPAQTATTIGDTLSAKGVAWAWYAQGYTQALDDGMQLPELARKVTSSRAPPSRKSMTMRGRRRSAISRKSRTLLAAFMRLRSSSHAPRPSLLSRVARHANDSGDRADHLLVDELLDAERAQLAAEAGLLGAAERQVRCVEADPVDEHHAGVEAVSDA